MFRRTWGLTPEQEALVRSHMCSPPTYQIIPGGENWVPEPYEDGKRSWYCPLCARRWFAPYLKWKRAQNQSRSDQRRRMVLAQRNEGPDVQALHSELMGKIEREAT